MISSGAARQIAKCRTGSADEEQLNDQIGQAWREALADPKQKSEIAKLLGVKADELDPDKAPFHAEITGAGFTGGEVLIALASGFVLGLAKDIGGAAGKAAAKHLRELWNDYMRDRVSPPGSGKLGKEIEETDGD